MRQAAIVAGRWTSTGLSFSGLGDSALKSFSWPYGPQSTGCFFFFLELLPTEALSVFPNCCYSAVYRHSWLVLLQGASDLYPSCLHVKFGFSMILQMLFAGRQGQHFFQDPRAFLELLDVGPMSQHFNLCKVKVALQQHQNRPVVLSSAGLNRKLRWLTAARRQKWCNQHIFVGIYHGRNMCIRTYVPTYIHTYLHTYIHTYRQTDIHTYIHIQKHVYIYIYTWLYMYTYPYCSYSEPTLLWGSDGGIGRHWPRACNLGENMLRTCWLGNAKREVESHLEHRGKTLKHHETPFSAFCLCFKDDKLQSGGEAEFWGPFSGSHLGLVVLAEASFWQHWPRWTIGLLAMNNSMCKVWG